MEVLKAILESFKIKNIKIAIYIWMFNFFLSFLVYYCFFHLFSVSAGSTILLENFSFQNLWPYLIEMFQNNESISVIFLSIVLLCLVLFVIISIFISGAIYSIFINEEEKTFKNLLLSSIENFFKIFKIFLINILNWIFIILFSGTIFYLLWLIQKNSGNESLVKILAYLWILITIFLLIFSMAIYDFSRIIRLKTERNFIFSFMKGIRFVFSKKMTILFLFVIYIITILLFHIFISIIFSQVENILHVLFLLFIFQIFIILKYYIKTIMMNAEVNIFTSSLSIFNNPD